METLDFHHESPNEQNVSRTMKPNRKIALVLGTLLALVFGGLITLSVLGPPGPQFICHRLLDSILEQWKFETTNSVQFPNVGGSSKQSLALLIPYLGGDTNALRDYRYVPGLHSDDPDNLVLFYLTEPSRRTWHGDTITHWFFGPKRWIVLNPRMNSPDYESGRAGGELDEAISAAEFRKRLRATLDFLKQNARPGWQEAEQEHMQFISSIQE
jgi:hypothetical protein